ncbi:nuclease [Streptomyces roseifaciens]
MSMVIIEGTYRVLGTQPDGDTIRFQPDDPGYWMDVPGNNKVDHGGSGHATVRFDGIDTLETHYQPAGDQVHQPLEFGHKAADEMLAWLGFAGVRRRGGEGDDRETVTYATPPSVPGFILAGGVDRPRGRCIALVCKGPMPVVPGGDGKKRYRSGDRIDVPVDLLRSSVTYHLLKLGLAYPTFYSALPKPLRQEMADVAQKARADALGLRPGDVTRNGGVTVVDLSTLTDHAVILPKLFRRLYDYIRFNGSASLTCLPAYLAGAQERFTVHSSVHGAPDRGKSFTGLHELFAVSGQNVKLKFDIEDVVFDEK